ncbi:LptE family protein [Flaviaesturariibacter amylovorans]|uniref:LptE family protein n=1 Tax=Flaviaesturariibacter amylovorans TaxID=1084520 RepID=UPI0031F07A3F
MTIHHSLKRWSPVLALVLLLAIAFTNSSCGVYSFRDVAIPDSIKSIRIQYIDNKAPYVNPQLSPALSERLRRKIQGQTRLSLTNADNADYDVKAVVTDYAVTTSGISNKEANLNRLTITVHISLTNNRNPNSPPVEYDINRPFDFGASLSLQQAEAALSEEIIRNLTDDIFNRLFSNW